MVEYYPGGCDFYIRFALNQEAFMIGMSLLDA
jgi:hypothetical protein